MRQKLSARLRRNGPDLDSLTGSNSLKCVSPHSCGVLEHNGHEPEVDKLGILVQPLALFAVVHQEVDIGGHPDRLVGRQVDAADVCVGEPIADFHGPDACHAALVGSWTVDRRHAGHTTAD